VFALAHSKCKRVCVGVCVGVHVGVGVHPCVAGRRRLDALVAVGGKNVSSKYNPSQKERREGYTLLPISRALHAASK